MEDHLLLLWVLYAEYTEVLYGYGGLGTVELGVGLELYYTVLVEVAGAWVDVDQLTGVLEWDGEGRPAHLVEIVREMVIYVVFGVA